MRANRLLLSFVSLLPVFIPTRHPFPISEKVVRQYYRSTRKGFGFLRCQASTGGRRRHHPFSGVGLLHAPLLNSPTTRHWGDEGCSGEPRDMERHGAAGVAMRVRRRLRRRHGLRFRLLQLHRFLVTPPVSTLSLPPPLILLLVYCNVSSGFCTSGHFVQVKMFISCFG